MQTVFDEMWYIVEYFIVGFFLAHCVLLVEIQDNNNIYSSCVNST